VALMSSTSRELRENATCYDGWYVAVAELLDARSRHSTAAWRTRRASLSVPAAASRDMNRQAPAHDRPFPRGHRSVPQQHVSAWIHNMIK